MFLNCRWQKKWVVFFCFFSSLTRLKTLHSRLRRATSDWNQIRVSLGGELSDFLMDTFASGKKCRLQDGHLFLLLFFGYKSASITEVRREKKPWIKDEHNMKPLVLRVSWHSDSNCIVCCGTAVIMTQKSLWSVKEKKDNTTFWVTDAVYD